MKKTPKPNQPTKNRAEHTTPQITIIYFNTWESHQILIFQYLHGSPALFFVVINAYAISKNTAAIIYMELIKRHNTNSGVIMYANS